MFFATNNDWCNLFDSIYSKGLYIIDDNGNGFSLCEVRDILHNPKNKIFMYYIVKDNWKIDYNGTFIFPLTSELIELSICRSIPQTTVDLSPVDKHFQKGEYIVVNDRDKYLKLYEDYMKDPIYVPNPHYIENGYELDWFAVHTSNFTTATSTVCLKKGDQMIVPQYGANYKYNWDTVTLNFTYMNVGYVGYNADNGYGADVALTVTTYRILSTGEVIITRWDKNGEHNLKSAGVKNTVLMDTFDPDLTVYESSRVVTATDDRKYEGE